MEDIDADFCLTTIKPLHAQWLLNMHNFLTGVKIILKGWKKWVFSGLIDDTMSLPSENPFESIYDANVVD